MPSDHPSDTSGTSCRRRRSVLQVYRTRQLLQAQHNAQATRASRRTGLAAMKNTSQVRVALAHRILVNRGQAAGMKNRRRTLFCLFFFVHMFLFVVSSCVGSTH
jgi:Flp pilus assembly protein TadB